MPLGQSPILLTNLMAEGDANKHILFNDAVVKLEDSVNRQTAIDASGGDFTVSESLVVSRGILAFTDHTTDTVVTIPPTLNGGGFTTNRILMFRNLGTGVITITHDDGEGGDELILTAGSTGIAYCDGTDIVPLGGTAGPEPKAISDNGTELVENFFNLNFAGSGVELTDDGNGEVTVTIAAEAAFTTLSDTPENYTGAENRIVRVNTAGDAIEFVTTSTALPGSAIKTAYEGEDDTNAFTDALLTKLNDIEDDATADLTAEQIETLLDAYYGDEDWRTGGTVAPVIETFSTNYTMVSADIAGDKIKKSTSATAVNFTVNSGLSGDHPVIITQNGAGQVTIVAGSGVTINSADNHAASRVQFSAMTLIPDGTDTYILIGDIA